MNEFVGTLKASGYEVLTENWFDTVTIKTTDNASFFVAKALERGINIRYVDADHVAVSFDETTDRHIVSNLLGAFTDTDLLILYLQVCQRMFCAHQTFASSLYFLCIEAKQKCLDISGDFPTRILLLIGP